VWVQVSDSFGCIGSDTVFVNVENQPTLYLGNNIEACVKDVINLSVENVYDNFNWSTGETGTSIMAHDGSVIMPGLYSFWVTGSNDIGECSYTDTIYITLIDCDSSFVGIDDNLAVEQSISFEVYPNPSRDLFNVKGALSSGVTMDRIVLMIAKVYNPSDWSSAGDNIQLDIRNLANGVYLIRLEHSAGINNARVIIGK
jgi:hypothetical protein